MAMTIRRESGLTPGRDTREVFLELEHRIHVLEEALLFEKHLRAQNPALQDLYDKYQLTKGLIT